MRAVGLYVSNQNAFYSLRAVKSNSFHVVMPIDCLGSTADEL